MNFSSKPHRLYRIELSQEGLVPMLKGFRIVQGNIAKTDHLHIGFARQSTAYYIERRKAAAGENIALDKIDRSTIFIVALRVDSIA